MSVEAHFTPGPSHARLIYRREALYKGPFLAQAADLILEPQPGYDPKANVDKGVVAARGEIGGMHILEDAFLLRYPGELPDRNWQIVDVMPGILNLLGVDLPGGLDGMEWH